MTGHWQVELICFVPLLACFAAFTGAVKRHFRSTGPMPPGMKLISLLSLVGFLWFAWRIFRTPLSPAWPAAPVLAAAALAIFFWAIRGSRATPPTLAFDTDRPVFLIQQGPYRFVRHPFYLAYSLFWIATALATLTAWGWIAPAAMVALYTHAATGEERKFASSDLAPAYARYRRQAGMFLPRLSALRLQSRAPLP